MTTRDPVIQTRGLTRRFGEHEVVHSLDLTVERGEVFGMLGHNGAGKTTTVRLLNGVLAPSAGEIRVLGFDPVTQGPALRARTGVSTETPSFDERLTARQGLTIFAELFGVPTGEVKSRVNELLELFELQPSADQKVGGFSKGMKQKLALARTLLHSPELLFWDEPSSGLDPVASLQVDTLIRQLRAEGKTVFLCTHNLRQAQALCDRVAVLERGKILALGTPSELVEQLRSEAELELEVDGASLPRALALLEEKHLAVSHHPPLLKVSGVAREEIPELISALAAARVRIYRASPGELGLEAVYFALHRAGRQEVSR